MSEISSTAFLKTGRSEIIKQFFVYDGSSRMIEVYEAPVATKNNGPCLKTEYVYQGSSTRVIKMKESHAVWDSDWDV